MWLISSPVCLFTVLSLQVNQEVTGNVQWHLQGVPASHHEAAEALPGYCRQCKGSWLVKPGTICSAISQLNSVLTHLGCFERRGTWSLFAATPLTMMTRGRYVFPVRARLTMGFKIKSCVCAKHFPRGKHSEWNYRVLCLLCLLCEKFKTDYYFRTAFQISFTVALIY